MPDEPTPQDPPPVDPLGDDPDEPIPLADDAGPTDDAPPWLDLTLEPGPGPDLPLEPGPEPGPTGLTVPPEPFDAGAGLGSVIEAVKELGERIDVRFGDLLIRIDRETRAEAAREKVIDRLHAELQDYKQDLLLSTLRPVFIDLIQLHDDIGKVAPAPSDETNGGETGGASEAAEARRLRDVLESFQQGIEDILYRQGVEPFRVDGETFDPRQQRAVSAIPTEDISLNKTVAARLRKGFKAGDRVIRPEIVSVYAVKK